MVCGPRFTRHRLRDCSRQMGYVEQMNSASISLSDPRIVICGAAIIAATLIDLFLVKRHSVRWLLWSAVGIPLVFIIDPIPDQNHLLTPIAGRVAFGVVAAGVLVLRAVLNDALRRSRRGGAS